MILKKYGVAGYNDDHLTGTYFTSLIDFNRDGINELVVFYTKEGMKPVNVKVYTYDQKAMECKCIFDYSGDYVDDGMIVYTKNLSTNYLLLNDGANVSSYTYENGKIVKKETSDGGEK